jgi:hypothetical protein
MGPGMTSPKSWPFQGSASIRRPCFGSRLHSERTRFSSHRHRQALVGAAPWISRDAEKVTADLATLAGLGLAPEGPTGQRVRRRGARRERRWDADSANYRHIRGIGDGSS